MKIYHSLILLMFSVLGYSQNIESISTKLSDAICECVKNDMKHSSEIRNEFNRCYDQKYNQIFNLVTPEEQKILLRDGALKKINAQIIPNLNTNCQKIRKLIETELISNMNSAADQSILSCPVNFIAQDVDDLQEKNGEIIAFEGVVSKMSESNNKALYQIKLGNDKFLWVASLLDSKLEKIGKKLRVLGYVSNQIQDKSNESTFQIIALAVVDMTSKEMEMLPGAHAQIQEWINGRVPKAKE